MPRQANVRILQAIADLTKHAGYPPTFDEVAVEAGFPRNSRGAVYKQLVRLRGQYVEWEDQIPRSLRLLNADLIHMASNSGEALAPESGQTSSDLLMLFSLLASGLTQLLTRENLNRQLPIYPDALRRGLSQLALWAIQNGKSYPRDLPEAMGLFRTPFRN